MIVFVNDIKISVHYGARVRDAILKYDHNLLSKVAKGLLMVRDHFGNERMPDGALSELEHLYIIDIEEKI